MNKRKKIKTLVELGKDILIIVLICSALWMLGSGTMGQRLDLGRQDLPQSRLHVLHQLVECFATLQLLLNIRRGIGRCLLRRIGALFLPMPLRRLHKAHLHQCFKGALRRLFIHLQPMGSRRQRKLSVRLCNI